METNQENFGANSPIPPHILVMEDEVNIAKGLQMILNEEGYDVDLAMTGQSALDKSKESIFDLLIADLKLPDIDGMKVIREVKKLRPQMEAIIITGFPSVSSAVESVKIGVREYLRKPFTEDEVKQAVKEAFQKKKQAANIEEVIVKTEKQRLIQKQEVIRVLDRTSRDADFWRELMENGSSALEDYQLSNEAKAAIICGDLKWIKEHVGELNKEQLMFIYKRLEREAW